MAGKDEIMSMEKVHSKKVARREGGESTGTHDLQHSEETQKLSISIQKKVTTGDKSSLEHKFQRLTESYEKGILKPPMAKIQRVPFSLSGHKNFEKYFEPRGVALGPIHHGKPGLELAEEYKQRLAEYFIRESGCNKFDMYNEIEKDIKNLRACYEGEVTKCYDDEELAWMLLVDGCSLLVFITCMADPHRTLVEHLKLKYDLAAFGQQDAFLLENQLPFRLLKLLIDQSIKDRNRWIESIHNFMDDVRNSTIRSSKSEKEKAEEKMNLTKSLRDDCPHLLHLLRERLLGDQDAPNSNENQPLDDKITRRRTSSSSGSCHESKPSGDLSLNVCDCLKCCNPVAKLQGNSRNLCKCAKSDKTPITFRNIMELQSAGIRVRPNKSSNCLNDIDFRTEKIFFPTLLLPRIEVDDWTAPKFLNLVAYEMCPDFFNDMGITSYVCFLDSLIDQPDDVKYLRDKEILYNVLGSDEEVAILFNEISTDLVPNDQYKLTERENIQKQYKRPWSKWVTQGYYKYFSNPWTLIALFGALLGLALSFIQTWKALEDSCTKICKA